MGEMKGYSFKITLWKGVKTFLSFSIPYLVALIVDLHPEITSLTVGTLLVMIMNWVKNKDG